MDSVIESSYITPGNPAETKNSKAYSMGNFHGRKSDAKLLHISLWDMMTSSDE